MIITMAIYGIFLCLLIILYKRQASRASFRNEIAYGNVSKTQVDLLCSLLYTIAYYVL